jgi:predicted nucleotidyltransferase
MSEREISRLLNVSHMSVNRAMRELEDLNFVHPNRVGRAHVWKVNRKSYAFEVFSKIMETLSKIKDPLADFKTMILENLPLASVEKLVLFGSIARRVERSDSDIDLFILVNDESAKTKIGPAVGALTLLCLDKFGNTLSPYILTLKQMKEKDGFKLLSGIKAGIVLYQRDDEDVSPD